MRRSETDAGHRKFGEVLIGIAGFSIRCRGPYRPKPAHRARQCARSGFNYGRVTSIRNGEWGRESVELIDDQGNLFGFVNVIDALAILIVVAVIVAGVSLFLAPEPEPAEPPETTSKQAVLDLGTVPAYLVEHISVGDSSSPGSTGGLEITEVYVAPSNGGVETLISLNLSGRVDGGQFSYNGQPVHLGRELGIVTDTYQVSGAVRALGSSLKTADTSVLVEATVDSESASRIDAGDRYSLAGRDIATVESVQVFGTNHTDRRRAFIGLSLRTVDLGRGPQFAGTPLRPGGTVPLRTDQYALEGEIRRVGATELRGDPATRTVTLRLPNVDPQLANSLREGTSENDGDGSVVRLIDVDIEPSTVVLTSQDGNIYLREHPVKKDVTLTAELKVRETTTGPTFKGQPLKRGSTIVLDLGTATIQVEVVGL